MEVVTKRARPKRRCQWCRNWFKPKSGGRPPVFCNPSCRQRAYEKRKWTPFTGLDALALDLLPAAAARRLRVAVRHDYMIELIMKGTVPLIDPDQIDGVLDPLKPQDRMALLRRIEDACRRRQNSESLQTIARWRLSRQHRRSKT